MPLYKTIQPNSQTTVKIWKITEPFTDLMQSVDLKPKSLQRVLGMKSELHQRGFLSVRHLLKEFGYTDVELHYDSNGKPYLKDGKYISITHSFTFSAIIISDFKIGIDIEKQRDKIVRIANRFIGYENQYLVEKDSDYMKKLTTIWCIKESLYKLFATPGLSFKQHTLVIPFTFNDEATTAWIDYKDKKHRFNANYFEFEGFTCAYVFPK
ncbi:Siderophore (Surfactin) biosynthesis regulatory protein [hydrothermal vent metagenome]|uniref:Siderophore (Surfactin) biosynthesis regulatory protein n=1 Tax=hydrothermal vent metagenome TaxID=652676 RepID=A0A3B0R9S2_9ZZZZ